MLGRGEVNDLPAKLGSLRRAGSLLETQILGHPGLLNHKLPGKCAMPGAGNSPRGWSMDFGPRIVLES
jgi:hypothetical protein